MPALSPTMKSGTLAKWLKKEGDNVEPGEALAEIETDKATMEVEAVDEGKLAKILVKAGTDNVAVNSVIAILLEEGEKESDIDSMDSAAKPADKKDEPKEEDKKTEKKPKEEENKKTEDVTYDQQEKSQKSNDKVQEEQEQYQAQTQAKQSGSDKRVFASPLARRMAQNEGVNLSSVGQGSGPNGRIVKQDILELIKNGSQTAKNPEEIVRNDVEYNSLPNNNMRKVIAQRLQESKQQVPHFYLSIDCQIDSLMEIRAQINQEFGDDKAKKLSINDFVILASALALKQVPEANSSWIEEAIIQYNNIDVSVAVSIEGGLITPVLKNADQKDIFAISNEMKFLANKARKGDLQPHEYQGGGFTVSNLGMFGVRDFYAIINPPQSCILSVGASEQKTIVKNGEIEVATIMSLGLSCDHRVVDGTVGAKFLQSLKKFIESPILMFI